MEKLVAAILLLDNSLRRMGFYDNGLVVDRDDIPYEVGESWLRVLAIMKEMGHEMGEDVAVCVEVHQEYAESAARRIEQNVNYWLGKRSLSQRMFGPQQLNPHQSDYIRDQIEDIVGIFR